MYLELAKWRQQAGAIGLHLAVLFAQPKLGREPVALQEASNTKSATQVHALEYMTKRENKNKQETMI